MGVCDIFQSAVTAVSRFINGTPEDHALRRAVQAETAASQKGVDPLKDPECRRTAAALRPFGHR